MRAGVLSYAPGSESEHVSLVSPFIDWARFVGLVLVVLFGGVFCFALCVSYNSMTATVVTTSAAKSKKKRPSCQR